MLESPEDAYTGYLQVLLGNSDVDEGVVRETLISLGYSAAVIDEMLGGGPHMCSTSTSSSSRDIEGRSTVASILSYKASVKPADSVVLEGSASRPQSSAEHETPLRLDDEVHHIRSSKSSSATKTSLSSSSSSPSLSPPWQPSVVLRDDRKSSHHSPPASDVTSHFLDDAWGGPIKNPERRDRYMRHLLALEELLGVVLFPDGKKAATNESIPLEIRGFICRQRLQKWLFSQFGTTPCSTPQRHQGINRPPVANILPMPEGKSVVRSHRGIIQEGNHEMRRARSCGPQSKCWRHPGKGPLGVLNGIGKHQLCELCTNFEERPPFPGKKKNYSTYPQRTAAASTGDVCGVRMRPPAVLNVGCGRLNTRAVETTLLKREDRVRKVQVYLNAWYGGGKLDGGRDRTVRGPLPSVAFHGK